MQFLSTDLISPGRSLPTINTGISQVILEVLQSTSNDIYYLIYTF